MTIEQWIKAKIAFYREAIEDAPFSDASHKRQSQIEVLEELLAFIQENKENACFPVRNQ